MEDKDFELNIYSWQKMGGCAKCKGLEMKMDPDKEAGQEWVLEDLVSAPIVNIRSLTGEVPHVMSRNAQNAVNL